MDKSTKILFNNTIEYLGLSVNLSDTLNSSTVECHLRSTKILLPKMIDEQRTAIQNQAFGHPLKFPDNVHK